MKTDFEAQFFQFLKLNCGISKGAKILIACSGGPDSVVLLHLLSKANLEIELAHCNFKLRGYDADADEKFVKSLAKKFSIPFHSMHFETEKFAKSKGISIQMAARNLRYKYFSSLIAKHKFNAVAVGTHQSDQTETMLLNLTKGCGIKGIHGIYANRNKIIRPLLFASKNQILTYCKEGNISFREDASNLKTNYERNFIRHEVIPKLKKLNPEIDATFSENARKFSDYESIVNQFIEEVKSQVFEKTDYGFHLNFASYIGHSAFSTILWELLSPYGFDQSQIEKIASQSLKSRNKSLHASEWALTKESEKTYLLHKQNKSQVICETLQIPGKLNIGVLIFESKIMSEAPSDFSNNHHVFFADYDKIKNPLNLKTWEKGSKIKVLGMKGSKNVSDVLNEAKKNKLQKDEILVLESNGEILWIPGMKRSNLALVSEKSSKILKISCSKNASN